MDLAESPQLALFRPAAIILTHEVDRHQVIARVRVDDVFLYLTREGTWSPNLQDADAYSCQGIAAAFVRNSLCRDPASCELVSYLPVVRGLVVLP